MIIIRKIFRVKIIIVIMKRCFHNLQVYKFIKHGRYYIYTPIIYSKTYKDTVCPHNTRHFYTETIKAMLKYILIEGL
jgi:hypothetical protein